MVQLYNYPFQKEIDGLLVDENTENSEDESKDILDDLEILLDETLSSPSPLSQKEKRLFREEIERCWNVLKLEVHGINQITLAFSMDRDARADPKSFLLINSKGGMQKIYIKRLSLREKRYLNASYTVMICLEENINIGKILK